jgi:galactose mutarotase-like enzyme
MSLLEQQIKNKTFLIDSKRYSYSDNEEEFYGILDSKMGYKEEADIVKVHIELTVLKEILIKGNLNHSRWNKSGAIKRRSVRVRHNIVEIHDKKINMVKMWNFIPSDIDRNSVSEFARAWMINTLKAKKEVDLIRLEPDNE